MPPCSFYLSVSLLNDFHCFISETLLFAEGKKLKSQPWQHPFSCSTAFTRTCTHTQTMTQTYPGWRLVPVADESRHDGSEACNEIYRAGLTFQIQSGTLITDENLRQEIALIAN